MHVEDPHKFVLTEVWDSKEHYEKYAAFRVEDGTVAAIGNMCGDGPNIDIFDITGHWKVEGAMANRLAKTMPFKHKGTKSGHKAWWVLLITYKGDGIPAELAEKARHGLDALSIYV